MVLQEVEVQETSPKVETKSDNGNLETSFKSKEEELNRREEYLKKLEKELLQKEEDIRVNLHLTPATTVQTSKDVGRKTLRN